MARKQLRRVLQSRPFHPIPTLGRYRYFLPSLDAPLEMLRHGRIIRCVSHCLMACKGG